jgi:hypothetical protein
MSPIVAVAREGSDIVIVGLDSFETCGTNITCEKTSEHTYQCHTTTLMIGDLGRHVHQISTGKIPPIIFSYPGIDHRDFRCFGRISQLDYSGPDTFVYPFVGIIKIQV